MHSFSGEQSPVDLELAFQMIHRLFTHAVTPVPEDLATCMKMLRQSLASEIRNPMRAFYARVRYVAGLLPVTTSNLLAEASSVK